MYGKATGLDGVEELLHSITGIETVSSFESFSLLRNHLIRGDVDMIFLDADDEITDWRYLLQRFREINDRAKLVLISSTADQSVRAYEAGVFDYLLKPVQRMQIGRVISKERITP